MQEPPAGPPVLVLLMWGRPPGLGGSPAAIDAHPMIRNADGSIDGSPRDHDHPAGPGALRSLVFTADAAADGTMARWHAEYRTREAIDEPRAAIMHNMLDHITAGLDRAAADDGPPADYTDYLTRAAAALGISGPSPFAVHVPLRQGGPATRYLTAAELRTWLPDQARRLSNSARQMG